ncbi:histidine phosphatase family protein [Patescibacteria group bacterium]|nr:histidine phosphatase family protein [Patescibacteria group bacterium]
MSNIYFLRHGQSHANLKGLISSKLPGSKLTSAGINQSKIIAKKIKKIIDINIIYCSPFQRTIQTLKHLKINSRPLFKNVIIEDRIREIDYGIYDSQTVQKKELAIKKTLNRIYKGDNEIRFGITGENEEEIMARIGSFLVELIKKRKNALVITHQCVVDIILGLRQKIHKNNQITQIFNCHFQKIVFNTKDISPIKKILKQYKGKQYSPYLLVDGDIYAKTLFYPSVQLPKDIPISTPFTFPFKGNNVYLSLDKMGWWNPLGGHIERGETWKNTIKREAKEEAGVIINNIKIVGYVHVKHLIETENNRYLPESIIPITISNMVKYLKKWQKAETRKRGIFTFKQASKLLKKREDNNQMLEIFKYITNYVYKYE